MATPVIRAVGSNYNSTGNPAVTTPGTTAVGDTLFAFHSVDYSSPASLVAPTPGTWELVSAGTQANFDVKLWRRATTVAGAQTVTAVGPSGNGNHLHLFTFAGAVVLDGAVSSAGSSSGGTTSQEIPGVEPATADALLLGSWSGIQFNGAMTYSPPAGMTEQAERNPSVYAASMTASEALATAGATGSRTATTTVPASSSWVALLLAVRSVGQPVTPGAGAVIAAGPAPTVTLVNPSVQASPDAGPVSVTGPAPDIDKIYWLAAAAVAVSAPAPTVGHRVSPDPGMAAVDGPVAFAAGTNPQPGVLTVFGPPAQVLYIADTSASRRGLPPVVFPPTPRLMAQSILSGRWLSRELPVTDPEITWTLSGPQLIGGKFEPEIESLAELGLDAWATWIHVEDAGEIRGSGILLPASIDGDTLSFAAVGPSGYAARIPYRGTYSQIGVDPADVFRHLWEHIQGDPRGNLGVTVHGSTPVRLGTETADEVEFETGTGEQVSFDRGGPYKLDWFENTMCGAEIDELAKQTPFDYIERQSWDADKRDVLHWIDIGYPSIGRRLFGARFEQGENILEHSAIEEPEKTYADQVFVHGRGEGASTVTGYAGSAVGGRLRLPVVVEDKKIDNTERARAVASEELSARLAALVEVPEVVVDVHDDNAPLGSFGPGDEGLFGLHDLPYVGTYRAWSRIVSVRYLLDREVAVLALSRAGEFSDR